MMGHSLDNFQINFYFYRSFGYYTLMHRMPIMFSTTTDLLIQEKCNTVRITINNIINGY